jgi:hypothetical protein
LKDITIIENITQDMTSQYGDNPTYAFLGDASMDSIPQNPEKSTSKSDFSFENSANAEDRSANQQAAVEKKKRTTVEEVTESPAGSAKDMNTNDPFLGPEELSDISIAVLLAKVKGKAEDYIPKSDFSFKNVPEEADEQASGDFSKLWEAAGITQPSADLIRSLDALREMAAREGVGEQESCLTGWAMGAGR